MSSSGDFRGAGASRAKSSGPANPLPERGVLSFPAQQAFVYQQDTHGVEILFRVPRADSNSFETCSLELHH